MSLNKLTRFEMQSMRGYATCLKLKRSVEEMKGFYDSQLVKPIR